MSQNCSLLWETDTTEPEIDSVLGKHNIWHQWIKIYAWCSTQPFLLLFFCLFSWPREIGSEVVLVSFCSLTSHRVPIAQQKLLEDTYQHERREDRKHFWGSSWWKFCDLPFFQPSELLDQGSCKSALSSLVLGENQLHPLADALCSTTSPAHPSRRHLVMTTGKESIPLLTLPAHLEKNIRPGNCNISQAPMRPLLPWHHPQSSLNKRLHTGTQGWGRAVEPHPHWDLCIPYSWGSGSRKRFKVSSSWGRVDSHIVSIVTNCLKPPSEAQALTTATPVHSTGGTAHAICTFPEIY